MHKVLPTFKPGTTIMLTVFSPFAIPDEHWALVVFLRFSACFNHKALAFEFIIAIITPNYLKHSGESFITCLIRMGASTKNSWRGKWLFSREIVSNIYAPAFFLNWVVSFPEAVLSKGSFYGSPKFAWDGHLLTAVHQHYSLLLDSS